MSESQAIRLRLFGLRTPRANRIEEQQFPCAPDLTVKQVWVELQRTADPKSPLARIEHELVLALVNGTPLQRLSGWDTRLSPGDTLTFMAKAFGG